MEEKISINKEYVLNAYKHASEEQKALLENMFGKDMFKPKNIMERVKTFEDACEVLGEEHSYVQEYRGVANINFDFTQDIIAYLKLRIICAALNEGCNHIFNKDKYMYYPWFHFYTKEEYDKLDKDKKKECSIVGISHKTASQNGCICCSCAFESSSFAYKGICSRLAFKTEELAKYCGCQFIDIWVDYLFR